MQRRRNSTLDTMCLHRIMTLDWVGTCPGGVGGGMRVESQGIDTLTGLEGPCLLGQAGRHLGYRLGGCLL